MIDTAPPQAGAIVTWHNRAGLRSEIAEKMRFRFALLAGAATFRALLLLADGVTAAQVTLTHLVKVRILVGQLPLKIRIVRIFAAKRAQCGFLSFAALTRRMPFSNCANSAPDRHSTILSSCFAMRQLESVCVRPSKRCASAVELMP